MACSEKSVQKVANPEGADSPTTMKSLLPQQRKASGTKPAVVAILLAVGANAGLFALLGWINERAVSTADERIAETHRVDLLKPPPELPPVRRPEPPKPRRKPPKPKRELTVQRRPPSVRRRRVAPVPVRSLRLQLDLRTLTVPVAANVALPVPPAGNDAAGPGGTGGVAEGPEHYELSDVDKHPRRTRYVAPRFPSAAKRRGLSGTVKVQFIVDVEGNVKDVVVVASTGRGMFDEPARRAVSRWLFKPASRNGKPVPVRCVVNVDFKLVD